MAWQPWWPCLYSWCVLRLCLIIENRTCSCESIPELLYGLAEFQNILLKYTIQWIVPRSSGIDAINKPLKPCLRDIVLLTYHVWILYDHTTVYLGYSLAGVQPYFPMYEHLPPQRKWRGLVKYVAVTYPCIICHLLVASPWLWIWRPWRFFQYSSSFPWLRKWVGGTGVKNASY